MARFSVVPHRSRLWIDATSNVHPIRATADGVTGTVDISFDSAGLVSTDPPPSGSISIEARRLSAGNRLQDRELYRRIDHRRFPTITGTLHSMRADGAAMRYLVSGDICFRGVTRRYEDFMTLSMPDEESLTLSGTSRFDVRDFGISPPRVLVLAVHPEVEVSIEIFATREALDCTS